MLSADVVPNEDVVMAGSPRSVNVTGPSPVEESQEPCPDTLPDSPDLNDQVFRGPAHGPNPSPEFFMDRLPLPEELDCFGGLTLEGGEDKNDVVSVCTDDEGDDHEHDKKEEENTNRIMIGGSGMLDVLASRLSPSKAPQQEPEALSLVVESDIEPEDQLASDPSATTTMAVKEVSKVQEATACVKEIDWGGMGAIQI